MCLFIELVAQIVNFGSKAVYQRLLSVAFLRIGVRFVAINVGISLCKLNVLLAILRIRFLSGVKTILAKDEISPVSDGVPSFPRAHARSSSFAALYG